MTAHRTRKVRTLPPTPSGVKHPLTPRQQEVLELVLRGLTSREIAAKLHCGIRTVEVHRLTLNRRLGVHNVAQLYRVATARQLVKPSTLRGGYDAEAQQ